MASKSAMVVEFLEKCLNSESIEVGQYLKAIKDLYTMQFGFKDVQMFFLKAETNVLLNLVGLHYCISWLRLPVITSVPYSLLISYADVKL